ncbi:MAG: hypothetical protein QOF76_1726 [Solirubrobacteraceae bacterium]|jgi:hypothetical protein|nr:hypothetical protein [Solirubrobacteraceae bacterium]
MTAIFLAIAAAFATPGFHFSVHELGADRQAHMTGVSWHEGCPVPLSGLRLIRVSHYGFDRQVHSGRLVVNADATHAMRIVFRRLYQARFPLRRVRPVDAYGGDDYRSIEADNTSSFNCRNATGSTHFSQHAYGRAIDVNPIENPYVYTDGTTTHPASEPYLNRAKHRRGMAFEGGTLVAAFDAAGWGWGGRWPLPTDYQHFSETGG